MSSELIGVVGLIAVLILMFLKVPLAIAFIIIGGIGTAIIRGFQTSMVFFSFTPYTWASEYSFTVLPMFILMGNLVAETDIVKDLYATAHKWLGRLPGGLAMTTMIVSAMFGALCGSSVAGATSIGITCYPEMRRYGYSPALASGAIATGATTVIMIPPSLPMIIYGLVAQISIAKMFFAGFLPGIVQVLIFCLIIFFWVKLRPSAAPLAAESTTFVEKLKATKNLLPMLIIFLCIFGGMYGGVFTPTEAGAFGVAATAILSLVMRRLSWRAMRNALAQTVSLTAVVMLLIIGVMFFNGFMAVSGLTVKLGTWIGSLHLPTGLFLALIFMIYLALGCVLEEVSLMLLTLPFFLPIAEALHIDLIWFGIIIITSWQIGFLTPPVGLVVFVTKGVVKDVPLYTVFKGAIPFVAGLVFTEIMIILFPDFFLLPLKFIK